MNSETNFILRVDIDTYEGLKIGLPKVIDFVEKHNIPATIYLGLGKYATGRNIFRIIKSKDMKKRIAPWKRNHPKSIFRGILLPSGKIGEEEKEQLREYNSKDLIEFHPHGYNHVKWSSSFANSSYEKTCDFINKFTEEYETIFKQKPIANAAPNFQINQFYFDELKKRKFNFSSDIQYSNPFYIVFCNDKSNTDSCQILQLPVTEPSIEELILQSKNTKQISETYRKLFKKHKDQERNYVCFYMHAVFEPLRFLSILDEIAELVYKNDMNPILHSKFSSLDKKHQTIKYSHLYS
ncbi:MAG: hypothetical protein ACXABK_01800 [Candidatus Heimdallarchaeaceae archaeon]|jgi:hypothetical protein